MCPHTQSMAALRLAMAPAQAPLLSRAAEFDTEARSKRRSDDREDDSRRSIE